MKLKTGILLLAAVTATGLAQMQMPRQVVTAGKVKEVKIADSWRYTGQIVSPSMVRVTARVSGEILKIGFKDGDIVKAGQVLYQLDDVQYAARVKAAEAQVAESQATEAYAKSNFERYDNLYKSKTVSQDVFESAKRDYGVAVASTKAAEAELAIAKDNLQHCTITCPIDGRAGVTAQTVGNYITPTSGTLVTIIQTDPMRVKFAMSYRDFLAQGMMKGQSDVTPVVTIRMADDSVYAADGKFELINNEAHSGTDTLQLYALFPNPDGLLYQGGTVTVVISYKSPKPRRAIPPSAVMYDAAHAYVYVLDSQNQVSRRDIVVGSFAGDFQVVKEGLELGERIIVDGTHKAMPGMAVDVQEE
ncbi:MAG: efflux RND transporter periplasmic adaptor subunit [Victivallales bacterium]|nr:efflux RND transporter periplasmic adaptor subunit [Victivallales bacterium]